jgi:hypothetical protein
MRVPRPTVVLLLGLVVVPAIALAQQGSGKPAPPKPYKAVQVRLPSPINDPSLEAFRKDLGGIAQRKDRAALGRIVVAKGFFWDNDSGKGADPRKSGIDNLATALGLDAKDGSGWEGLAAAAEEPSASADPEKKGVVCAPAMPEVSEKDFGDLTKATQTDPAEWAYVMTPEVEMRAGAQPDSPVVEKLGTILVRVLIDDSPAAAVNANAETVRVVAPSGKVGYVPVTAVGGLASDQLCYVKEGGAWKIGGVYGGGDQQ